MEERETLFSARLKSLRKKQKLTQRQLATHLNISPSSVALYETGDRNPDPSMITKIADFFDVSTDYLLGRSNVPSRIETEAAHRTDDPMDDLPKEAREDIEKFKEFIRQKYGLK